MTNDQLYDCAFIGGGLAGLTTAIQLAQKGHKVILLEKEQYPFHKVCGEYISLESKAHLLSLGLPLDEMQLPIIKKLLVTSPSGIELKAILPLGGFGISRYTIDALLKDIAIKNGVQVMENCKVEDVNLVNGSFIINTTKGIFNSKICCGSFGKRSNIDVKWKRDFVLQSPNKLNNYIAVKYHVRANFPEDTIALHNFKDGYCGISKVEDDKYCLCYLTNAANLKESNNSIPEMEKNILSKNPQLKNILEQCKRLYESPLSISQISFQKKPPVENHVLMIGDAAGMITPLCGNGMSMAMHAGKIAAEHIDSFLKNKITREQMEEYYKTEWEKTFGKRIATGRFIQTMFGKPFTTNLFIRIMKSFPPLTRWLIRQTHGKSF